MKMNTLLPSFMLFACTFQTIALNSETQNTIIKLEQSVISVGQLITQIENQTDYLVVFKSREVDIERYITVQNTSGKMISYLEEAFKDTDITYEFDNRYILLLKKNDKGRTSLIGQQSRTITGTVTDNNGEPVIGANVIIKGTSIGTVTDVNGKYTLEVPPKAILQISYIGYLTKEIVIDNNKTADVILIEDTQKIDEVVVVGYGTQKKGEVASSISTIKSDNFVKTPTTDAAQLIKGKVPGLSIITPDANPTSTSQIALRGITTLKASSSPLVLIDGIPGDLNSVSPDDIEQIDVLKDGSAAAIYGTRGTNGVILITTKNANGEMPTEVDVNAYLSTQQITKTLPFMKENRRLDRAQHGHAGRKSISRPARAAKHGQARPATRTAGLLPRRDGQRERLCRPRTDAHLLIRGQRRTGQPGWHPLNQSHIEWTNTTFHSLLCLGQPQSRQDESMDRLSRIT